MRVAEAASRHQRGKRSRPRVPPRQRDSELLRAREPEPGIPYPHLALRARGRWTAERGRAGEQIPPVGVKTGRVAGGHSASGNLSRPHPHLAPKAFPPARSLLWACWGAGCGGSGVGGNDGRGKEAGLKAGDPQQNASSELSCIEPFPYAILQLPQLPEDSPKSTLAQTPPAATPATWSGWLFLRVFLPASPKSTRPRPALQAAVPLKARWSGASLLSRRTREQRRRRELPPPPQPLARHGHGVPGHRAAPVPATLGPRTAALSTEPERPQAAAAATAAPGPVLAPLRPRAPLHCARGARGTRCQKGCPGGLGATASGFPTRSRAPAWSAAETAAAAWSAPAPRRAEHLRAAAGSPRPGGARRGALLHRTGAAERLGLV